MPSECPKSVTGVGKQGIWPSLPRRHADTKTKPLTFDCLVGAKRRAQMIENNRSLIV